jgi:hypothetical protein
MHGETPSDADYQELGQKFPFPAANEGSFGPAKDEPEAKPRLIPDDALVVEAIHTDAWK